jgi:Uma2 family endonuclease
MGVPIKDKVFYTYEEYIALEQDSDIRYEYYYGEVFSMAGGSLAHNEIVTNMVASLKPRFRGKGCKLYAENVKLELTPQEFYVYPDIMILCKADEVEDDLVKQRKMIIR